MHCERCGTMIPLGVSACPNCGADFCKRETTPEPPVKVKIPIYIVLPVLCTLIFLLLHWIRYAGYEDVVDDYFRAMERGNVEAVTSLYNWDYIEAYNENKQKTMLRSPYADFFLAYKSTEDFVFGTDEYYNRHFGADISEWEITDTSRDLFRLVNSEITVEVRIDLEDSYDDVIAELHLRRDSGDWYITSCDCRYAEDNE